MRITISHNKSKQEVIKVVDRSLDDVFKGVVSGPIQIVNPQKSWNADTMTFSLTAKAGFLSSPIHGTVLVTDKDLTVDADLGLLEKFIGQDQAKAALESRVKGLLA